jgi:branched-chain amino acid transport system substrate-binding protein
VVSDLESRRVSTGRAHRGRIAGVVATLVVALGWLASTGAAPVPRPVYRIGVSLPVTGPDVRWGVPMLRAIELAVEDVNYREEAGRPRLETLVLDSSALGPDTRSRQRAAVAAYERFVADPAVIAAIGPQTSAEGRAVAVLLSRANLATITPSATTFDITDPSLRATFRPGGRAVYFRTVGTDLTQADAMARFAHASLGVRRVVLIDDGFESQVRLVDAFARRAGALGLSVLARRQIDWIQQDYREELRALAALGPDALYVGVRIGVGAKLARQIPGVMPSVRLLGTESLYNAAFPIQARPTGAEGWYVSNVAPDLTTSPAALAWAERFRRRFGSEPSGYSLTAYTAVMVIADAVGRVLKRGQPVTRGSVRDAIAATRLPETLSGPVAFDRDGDLERPAVSIYQVRRGAFRPVETVLAAAVKGGSGAP